jgi:excisionase family DNA binding protein
MYITRRQAAEQLSVSDQTIDDLITSGKLHRIKIGRRVAILAESLREYVAGCEAGSLTLKRESDKR